MDIKSFFKTEPPSYVSETLELLTKQGDLYDPNSKDGKTINLLIGSIIMTYFSTLNEQ